MVSDINPTVTTDYYHFHWNYWWIRHALTHGLNAYQTDYVFAPYTSSLALHTLAALWYPVWALLEPTHGTIVAMIGVFFTALVLNGYVFWVFLEEQGSPPLLALAGGVLLQGSAVMVDSTRWTMVNLMGWFWIPLVILLWMRITRARGRSALVWCLALGITLWAMILTDLQYAVFLPFVLLPVIGWTLLQQKPVANILWITTLGLCALGIGLGLLWVTGTIQAVLGFDRTALASTPAARAPSIEFPLGYVSRLDTGISLGFLMLPAYVAALLSLLIGRYSDTAAKASPRYAVPSLVWLIASAAPLVLSAGDSIAIAGQDLALPYEAFHVLLGGTFRYPERFANVFLIAGLAFALPRLGLLLEGTLRRRKMTLRIVLIGFLGACLWDVRVFASLPTRPVPTDYAFYRVMGREEYDYVVLEVPTAGASGEGIVGRSDWVATQFYGVTHGKRMVNGHLSRVDPWRFLYMETSDPMLAWLGQRRYLDEHAVRQQLEERIYSFPVGYIVIHSMWLPQNGPTLQEVLGFLNAQIDLVCPIWIEAEVIVYRTAWHPDGCPARTPTLREEIYTIDIGSADDQRFIGWGWHWREDIGSTQWRWMGDYPRLGDERLPEGGFLHSDLFVELPAGAYTMRFNGQSFEAPRTLQISANGELIGEVVVLPDFLKEYLVDIPFAGGITQLRFAYYDTLTPVEAGVGTDERRLSIAVDWVTFEPQQ